MTVINTNYLALVSQNNLRTSKSALGSAIERLSSGLRINNSKDDAAGMAIANRMTAQIRGMTQAARNANDGISLAQTAEGNLKEINGNLQRIRELAVQAANDTNSKSDRAAINTEIKQRMEEIDRIAKSAEFNGTHLLDDGTSVSSFAADAQTMTRSISFQIGANTNETQDVITIDANTLIDATVKGLGLGKTPASESAPAKLTYNDSDKKITNESGEVVGRAKEKFNGTKEVDLIKEDSNDVIGKIAKDGTVTKTDGTVVGKIPGYSQSNDTSIKNKIDADGVVHGSDGGVIGKADADAKAGNGGKIFDSSDATKQVGVITAEGKILVKETANSTDFTKEAGKIDGYKPAKSASVDATDAGDTAESARALIRVIDKAMTAVDTGRANLGAIQNRFESTINNLNNTINNLSASRSRIEDADYAVEVSNMTRAQILQQAGTSVLAQANQVPQTVLSLLR